MPRTGSTMKEPETVIEMRDAELRDGGREAGSAAADGGPGGWRAAMGVGGRSSQRGSAHGAVAAVRGRPADEGDRAGAGQVAGRRAGLALPGAGDPAGEGGCRR